MTTKTMVNKKPINEYEVKRIKMNIRRNPASEKNSILYLCELIKKRKLILNPEYQRNYILSKKEASKYVESVLLCYIIPQIQLFEEKNGLLETIDGQQRLTSLYKYINNEYCLSGLEVEKGLNGLFYKDLPIELQDKFNNYSIFVSTTKHNDDYNYKFMVFQRLNSGSTPLVPQEVRNCIYTGNALDLVFNITKNSYVLNFFESIGMNNERHAITEFVSRLLAISIYYSNLSIKINNDIDKFLEDGMNMPLEDSEIYKNKFIKIIRLIKEHIGIKSFKSESNRISKANIEAVFINLFNFFKCEDVINNSNQISSQIRNLINNDEDFLDKESLMSNSKQSVIYKSQRVNKIITNVIRNKTLDEKRFFSKEDKIALWGNELLEKEKVICKICDNKIHTLNDCEVDHIYPWSKGGKTTIENGQLVHSFCNKSKNNKIL